MVAPRIVLAGLGSNLHGLTWETERLLRIGRQTSADIVLRDFSVERLHAEIKHQGLRWVLRDLARNPAYPTLVNQVPLLGKDQVLHLHDVIQLGKVELKVVQLLVDPPSRQPCSTSPEPEPPARQETIRTTGLHVRVQNTAQQTWDESLETVTRAVAYTSPQQEKAVHALMRANHHLTHLAQPQALLDSILVDVVDLLQAQRGSILLVDPLTRELKLRATQSPRLAAGSKIKPFNQTLALRCLRSGVSLLCQDVNADAGEALTHSIRHGAMASVVCALLRTPDQRLGILHLDRGHLAEAFTEQDLQIADAYAASISIGLDAALQIDQQRAQALQTVAALAQAVDLRDAYTGAHTERVTHYSLLLAEELNLSTAEKYQIQIGAPLHDIGKISIDDVILRKPGKLTFSEFEQMKTHTTKGASMLDAMIHLLPTIPIVRHHHERWDGSGYPDRLAQEQIPLSARIVSIADAFDAMTSDRPYRAALPVEQAFLELVSKAGSHFDPTCVYAFLRSRHKVEQMFVPS